MAAVQHKDIPQLRLKAFRAVVGDLKTADADRVFRETWKLAKVILDRNIRRMEEIGENRLRAELRDALISLVEVGKVGRAEIPPAPIPFLDGFTVDVSDDEATKRSMQLLSGRLTNHINLEIRGPKPKLVWSGILFELPEWEKVPSKPMDEIAQLYLKQRSAVWRMMLAAWQIGHVSNRLSDTPSAVTDQRK